MAAREKEKAYKMVGRPAMVHSLETVALTKRQETKLQVVVWKMLKL